MGDDGGDVADYIPELATADPADFGLALVGMAGSRYEAGESGVPFTIQSVSKPFVYALALADIGNEEVLARVGVEPSGEGFNAISLQPGTGRPDNPLINAGAILTTSLVAGRGPEERFERILDLLSRCAGRELAVDEAVYGSERDTGDRNRALAHLMRAAGSLTVPAEEAVDVYFRQCSVVVTAADLATMGATLANGGVNPLTGDRVIDQRVAEQVLTVMATCGMYDYLGGVAVPGRATGQVGRGRGPGGGQSLAVRHRALQPEARRAGNSVRAVEASRAISERFSLHLMHQVERTGPTFVRVAGDGTKVACSDPGLRRTSTCRCWPSRATSSSPRRNRRSWRSGATWPTWRAQGHGARLDHVTRFSRWRSCSSTPSSGNWPAEG